MIKEKRINEQPIYLNYNRSIKFLGIIDYKSLTIIVIYIVCVLTILRLLPFNIEILTYIFFILVIPVIAIFFVNLNNESTIDVICTIIKFMFEKKHFVRVEETKYFAPKVFLKK